MPIDYTKRRPEPAPAQGAGVSLTKVTLTKSAPTVSLSKQQGGSTGGELRVNLNWNTRPAAGGGLFRRQGGGNIDLDLGCLYELTNGRKGVVQALGNSFISRNDGTPIIALDGDDRTGSSTEGENLRIDLSRLGEVRRVLIFTYIYEGTPNWAGASAVVTLYPQGGAPIEIHLDEHDPSARTCAIALLESTGTDLSVRREVRY
ncbi:MAG: stress protein, partial [Nocardiopsaceae bacterium]|nr:stress protein [Nocardiopsaceae bacterium]